MFAQETGVVINGVTWATRNVGAPKTFVTNIEDYGGYYQWNRKDTANFLLNDDYYASEFASVTTWLPANDPSPAGWRVPTSAELDSLLDAVKVTSEWTTENGINGYRFTDKATSKSIFLPAAGFRDREDGTLYDVDNTYGYYWSSTEYSSDAYYLELYGSGGAILDYFYKANGYSVRPVKNSSTGINDVLTDTENAKVTGYFDILGRKLTEEPTKGLYIIQYENGKTKKMIK